MDTIERTEVLDITSDLLDAVEDGEQPRQRIVNIFGIAGIGKSQAINQIYTNFSPRYPTLLVSLSSGAVGTVAADDEVLSFADLVARLRALPGLDGQLELPTGSNLESSAFTLTAQQFPVGDQPFLLLFDGVGDFSQWRWLQEAVIKPLLEKKQAVLVLTSYLKLQWLWELEEHCVSHDLATFTPDQIKSYLAQAGLDNLLPLTANILDYTQGYPLAVRFLVERLRHETTGSPLSPIEAEAALASFSPATRSLLDQIGVIRLVEVDVMLNLLEHLGNPAIGRADVLKALMELTTEQKLQDTSQGLPRQLAPRLRQAVRTLLDREAYLRICRTLADTYWQRANERPKTQAHALLEWLYFSSELVKDQGSHEREEWMARLRQLFQRAIAVHQEDRATANPVLFVLFYRDRELIDQLKQAGLDDAVSAQLNIFLEEVDQLLPTNVEQLNNNAFGTDFDATCQEVLNDLYDRMPTAKLPARLRTPLSFVLTMRRIIEPGQLDNSALKRRVGVESRLAPAEAGQVVNALLERGLLLHTPEQQNYRFHPLIRSLVAHADRKAYNKALLSVTTNSPQ